MLAKLSVHEFFTRLASREAPGGGSGAALVGLTGVSLLEMAAALCQSGETKSAADEDVARALARLHTHLESLLQKDAEVLARALPALTAVGPDGSSRDWNAALMQAVDIPFLIAQDCIDAIEIARRLLEGALPSVACDLKFAAMSCHTGLQGAVMLADLNISLLRDDASLHASLRERIDAILEKADRVMDQVLAQ